MLAEALSNLGLWSKHYKLYPLKTLPAPSCIFFSQSPHLQNIAEIQVKGEEVFHSCKAQLENSVSWAWLPREQYFWASVTWRRESVPVRMNTFSKAGAVMVASGCGVGEDEASWPLKASFFTETLLIMTREHVTIIKINYPSSARWLWYLNKRSNKNYLKCHFPHEKGNYNSHIKHSAPSYSQNWAGKRKKVAPEVGRALSQEHDLQPSSTVRLRWTPMPLPSWFLITECGAASLRLTSSWGSGLRYWN